MKAFIAYRLSSGSGMVAGSRLLTSLSAHVFLGALLTLFPRFSIIIELIRTFDYLIHNNFKFYYF